MELFDSYLKNRETEAGRNQRAWIQIHDYLNTLPPEPKQHEKKALKQLNAKHNYQDILIALNFRLENGTIEMQRCLYPLSYLSQGFMPVTLEAIRLRTLEAESISRERTLKKVHDLEEKRAKKKSQEAESAFFREYPTAELQERAILRIYEQFRASYAGLQPDSPIFRKIAVIVTQMGRAELAVVAQVEKEPDGRGMAASSQQKRPINELRKELDL